MGIPNIPAGSGRYRLEWGGSVLELASRRAGLRTAVVLLRDGHAVGEGTGAVRVVLPVPEDAGQPADDPEHRQRTSPTVLALSVFPGVISRAFLLVPKPGSITGCTEEDGHGGTDQLAAKPGEARPGAPAARPGPGVAVDEMLAELPKGVAELAGFAHAERRLFDPPPGTLGARLLAFQRKHPRLYASRHVALAVGKMGLGLLSVALFFQLILQRAVQWIAEHLPRFGWPSIPWPDIALPSIPWPDLDWPDLPDLTLPGWLLAVVATAKYWVPILVAVGLAVREARRRTSKRSAATGRSTGAPRLDQAGPADPGTSHPGEGSPRDAHR